MRYSCGAFQLGAVNQQILKVCCPGHDRVQLHPSPSSPGSRYWQWGGGKTFHTACILQLLLIAVQKTKSPLTQPNSRKTVVSEKRKQQKRNLLAGMKFPQDLPEEAKDFLLTESGRERGHLHNVPGAPCGTLGRGFALTLPGESRKLCWGRDFRVHHSQGVLTLGPGGPGGPAVPSSPLTPCKAKSSHLLMRGF